MTNVDSESISPGEPTENEIWQRARIGLAGLLARLWIREINAPLLQEIHSGVLSEPFINAGGFVPATADDAMLETLAIEYCACFLGPKNHLPPYQSVVVSSQFQATVLDSLQTYLDVIALPDEMGSEAIMRDHVGVLLLLLRQIESDLLAADDEDAAQLQHLRRQFFADHLVWIKQYCEVAEARTTSSFYSSLFRITSEFLSVD